MPVGKKLGLSLMTPMGVRSPRAPISFTTHTRRVGAPAIHGELLPLDLPPF